MTPRGTDWTLALLVIALAATGALTLFAGARGDYWVFIAHDALGFALGAVVVIKLRRVGRKLRRPDRWDRRTTAGVTALAFVSLALLSGWLWSGGADVSVGGFRLLAWHEALGAVLVAGVLVHMALRARRPRRRDVTGRRQLLTSAAIGAGAVAAWSLQRPLSGLLGLGGDRRRFTGSYERGSFRGNSFPVTSWVADDPRPVEVAGARVAIAGPQARRPVMLSAVDLDGGDELVATLDCTGGFHSTQRWRGTRLDRLLARAAPASATSHVRVISRTGYRWSFPVEEAGELLLATHVGDEPLSHGHGAPVRLVAPGHRGFEWVKWVERIELHDGPDAGALASTVWSSFTAAGRARCTYRIRVQHGLHLGWATAPSAVGKLPVATCMCAFELRGSAQPVRPGAV